MGMAGFEGIASKAAKRVVKEGKIISMKEVNTSHP